MKTFFKKIIFSTVALAFLFSSFPIASAAVPTLETNPSVLGPLGVTSGMTTGNLGKRIQEFIFKIATENLKRSMLDSLVGQMITGIAGGQPQFVRNWDDFLLQNRQRGQVSAIQELQDQGFFGQKSFDSLIRSKFTGESSNYSGPSLEEQYRAQHGTFDWNNFINSWNPENNYYGKSLMAENYVRQRAEEQKEAAKSEAIAGGGFLSSKDEFGNITTPGKTIGDTLSRAVTSDIDYIVNAEDIGSFVSAISNSIFNNVLRQGSGGVFGLANNILSGNANIGSFNFDSSSSNASFGAIGSVPLEKTDNKIIFDSSSDALLGNKNTIISSESVIASGLGTDNPEVQNLIQQEIDNLGAFTVGSPGDFTNLTLGGYKNNKISSYTEVQKTIWYLDDIIKTINLSWPCVDNNGLLIPNLGDLISGNRETTKQEVSNLKSTLEGILSSLDGEISSATGNETEEQILRSSIEKELYKDLFLAGVSYWDKNSQDFDILDKLPINLDSAVGYQIYKEGTNPIYMQGIYSGTIYASCSYGSSNYVYPKTAIDQINYFKNNISIKYSGTVSGQGNYLNLTMSSGEPNEFFYFHPDKIISYTSSLKNYITSLQSKINTLDQDALSRRISHSQNKALSLININKAMLYLFDVERGASATLINNSHTLTDLLDKNLKSEVSSIWQIDVSESELEFSQNQRIALTNLYSVGLGQIQGNNFDVTNKLPVNTNQDFANSEDSPVEMNYGNVKTSYAPFSSNVNFLAYPASTVFYYHPINKTIYINTLNDKIDNLKSSGFLQEK